MATKLQLSEDWYLPDRTPKENTTYCIKTEVAAFHFYCRSVLEANENETILYGKLFEITEKETERHDYGWRIIVVNKKERKAFKLFLKEEILPRNLEGENRKIIIPFFKLGTLAPENYLFV